MSELKFRVWDTHRKTIYPAQEIRFKNNELLAVWRTHGERCLVEGAVPIMQYIGAKDKNGIEIYEGDVIRENARRNKVDYVIRWSAAACGFVAEPLIVGRIYPNLNQGTMVHYEVIGNIYESPELVSNETDT